VNTAGSTPGARKRRRTIDVPFERGYAALAAFGARHGHVRVPKGHVEDGVELSLWLNTQRARVRNGRMSAEHAEALARLGWQMIPAAERWQRSYTQLVAFHARHGHTRIPRRHPLRGWYHAQWRAHDGGTLPDDRRELLDRLRFFADRRPTGRPAGPGAQPQPRPRRRPRAARTEPLTGLTRADLARRYGVHQSAITRAIQKAVTPLPSPANDDRPPRWDPEEFDAWWEQQKAAKPLLGRPKRPGRARQPQTPEETNP
jgi:hypothetical protein